MVGFADGLKFLMRGVVARILVYGMLTQSLIYYYKAEGMRNVPGCVIMASLRYAFLISNSVASVLTPNIS